MINTSEKSYEELYGVSIEKYCELQKKEPEEILLSIKIDIQILEANYKTYASRNSTLTDKEMSIALAVKDLIVKKRKNYERLEKFVHKF